MHIQRGMIIGCWHQKMDFSKITIMRPFLLIKSTPSASFPMKWHSSQIRAHLWICLNWFSLSLSHTHKDWVYHSLIDIIIRHWGWILFFFFFFPGFFSPSEENFMFGSLKSLIHRIFRSEPLRI